MLYTRSLEELIFHRHEMYDPDELIVLSGYQRPRPVERLQNYHLIQKLYAGCALSIRPSLHSSLTSIHESVDNLNIFYSQLPVHSNAMSGEKGEIIHALLGSANFSVNGLTTPFREVLEKLHLTLLSP